LSVTQSTQQVVGHSVCQFSVSIYDSTMMNGPLIRCVLLVFTVFAVLQTILIAGTYGNQNFGVSDECRKALFTCAAPLALPYARAFNVSEALEIARNIRLGEHCRKARKALTCLQDAVGGNHCSDLDPTIVKIWKEAYEPIVDDVWKNICRTEFKKFSIHYSCLLTEEVYYGTERNCSSARNATQAADCVGRVVKEECGSTASKITKTLCESTFKRLESIRLQGFDRDKDDEDDEEEDHARDPDDDEEDHARDPDDDEEDHARDPDDDEDEYKKKRSENVYARSLLTTLEELLKRKRK